MNPSIASRIAALHDRTRRLREDAERRAAREEEARQRRCALADELYQALQPLSGLPLCRHEGEQTYRSAAGVGAGSHGDHHAVGLWLVQGFAVALFQVRSDLEAGSPYVVLAGGGSPLSVEDALALAVAAAEAHFDDSPDPAAAAAADDIPF